MAKLIPSLGSLKPRMQAGERRFAERLESHLEDDYMCWFDTPLGNRQRYADFIVLHPARGLLLLEVKDWRLDTLLSIDRSTAKIQTSSGIKHVSNPLEQARQCMYALLERLQQDPRLLLHSGKYQGQLCCPYGFGVVLSGITRQQFESTDLDEVLPASRVICKDEMTATVEAEEFQKRLWDMFTVQFTHALTLPQVDRIRWHLFPEIRVNALEQRSLFDDSATAAESMPDIVRVMDMQQEQLARSLGEGHRVIHGVAGSGKTMILGYRCLFLAQTMSLPILVLCFNVALAARLREINTERGIANQVQVYHFHDWCSQQLQLYHVARPEQGEDYPARLVSAVIAAVEGERIPRAQYGAVLIDEGHDFDADWLKLIAAMVNPKTNSLLLLYDDAQSIYDSSKRRGFSLSKAGIQARGRTTILKLNYRNTAEILEFAFRFASRYLDIKDAGEDGVPLVEPASAGRHGPSPVVREFRTFKEEANFIARAVRAFHDRDHIPWCDICVAYHAHWMSRELVDACRAYDIPVFALNSGAHKKSIRLAEDTVKLMSMHSSKGLEFPTVIVSGIGRFGKDSSRCEEEAKLLYVAMTRSTERLLITSDRNNEFVQALRAASLA